MQYWEENKEKIKYILTIVLTTIGVYLGFRYILSLVLPFLIAYFLAWIIRPTTEFMFRRMKIPRVIGGSVSLVALICLIGTGLFYLIHTLIRELIEFIRHMPAYMEHIAAKLENICTTGDEILGFTVGTLKKALDGHMLKMADWIKADVLPGLTQRTLSIGIYIVGTIGIILIIFISAVLIAKDLPNYRKRYGHRTFYKDMHRVTSRLADAGIAYLRTQLIIMIMIAFICVLGLVILRNKYALLIGVGIAIMDALPILGSGLILIPWGIIMLINGNIYTAAVLVTIFLICQILREILEPKLIGSHIGIKPLFTLISMYIGIRLFSIAGFILGPIGLIIIITVVQVVTDKLDIGGDGEKEEKPEEDEQDGNQSNMEEQGEAKIF